MTRKQVAEAACKSVYGSCSEGYCGLRYYYESGTSDCCSTCGDLGRYEFIYANGGCTTVGCGSDDDGSSIEDDSIPNNQMFVRKNIGHLVYPTALRRWTLAHWNLGRFNTYCRKPYNVVLYSTFKLHMSHTS